jgi:hypothetical protein
MYFYRITFVLFLCVVTFVNCNILLHLLNNGFNFCNLFLIYVVHLDRFFIYNKKTAGLLKWSSAVCRFYVWLNSVQSIK